MDKKEWRKEIASRLERLENREEKELTALQHLYRLEQWEKAKVVAMTLSFRDEFRTEAILASAFSAGKTVILPKVIGREMRFFKVDEAHPYVLNAMGIKEPGKGAQEIDLKAADLCLVPGRAFTLKGDRLGWGGGYYDQALSGYRGARVAVTFDAQVVDTLPTESFDERIDLLITESGVHRCPTM